MVVQLKNLQKIFGGGTTENDIIIEDDVWIGYGTTILAGVHIGTGCIIGAGSIVAKNLPPYSVYAGNKIIKKRFSDEIIDQLKAINWNLIKHKYDDTYAEFVDVGVNEENVQEIIKAFSKNEV